MKSQILDIEDTLLVNSGTYGHGFIRISGVSRRYLNIFFEIFGVPFCVITRFVVSSSVNGRRVWKEHGVVRRPGEGNGKGRGRGRRDVTSVAVAVASVLSELLPARRLTPGLSLDALYFPVSSLLPPFFFTSAGIQ